MCKWKERGCKVEYLYCDWYLFVPSFKWISGKVFTNDSQLRTQRCFGNGDADQERIRWHNSNSVLHTKRAPKVDLYWKTISTVPWTTLDWERLEKSERGTISCRQSCCRLYFFILLLSKRCRLLVDFLLLLLLCSFLIYLTVHLLRLLH